MSHKGYVHSKNGMFFKQLNRYLRGIRRQLWNFGLIGYADLVKICLRYCNIHTLHDSQLKIQAI